MEQRPKKLLEQVQDVIRLNHYSYQTEKTYIYWIRRYIPFQNKRHPKDMESTEIEAFLTHFTVNENVATSTQNQALHAVLFLYKGNESRVIVLPESIAEELNIHLQNVKIIYQQD